MPDTSVKYFLSTMSGAPAISGSVGAGIGVLDACLINGFGSVTISSLVVSDGIATATVSTGHGFIDGVVVMISGATPAELNGETRLIYVSTTQFMFSAEGISNQTATGTISVKMAPLGWEKAFSGTNLAAYRGIDGDWVRPYLRIDDTGTYPLYARLYESMSDINTGDNPVPTVAQLANGLNWKKSNDASTAARAWAIIGDGRFFYLGIDGAGTERWAWYSTGALARSLETDLYAVALTGNTDTGNATDYINGFSEVNVNYDAYTPTQRLLRLANGSIGGLRFMKASMHVNTATTLGTTASSTEIGAYGPAYASPLMVAPVLVREETLHGAFRGVMPGMGCPLQNMNAANITAPTVFSGVYPGPALLVPSLRAGSSSSTYNFIAFDITGPWR
jgi:hypothetical protein